MKSQQIQPIQTSQYTTRIKTEAGLLLWETRHSEVLKFIAKHKVDVMVDLGSSQCTLLQKVQRGLQVKRMIGVDIDLNIMPRAIENLKPETIQQDLQFQRNFDQIVQLRHGSALIKYQPLKQLQIDLVTLVEVIQHIEEKYLQELNQNVFGFLRPTYVWMSTPNSDFNPLFNWQKGRIYRHDDHKFQWTRAQFQQYVDKVCQKYNYRATISGVGESFFEEHKDKGFCSQIAIFQRLDFSFDKMLPQNINKHNYLSSQQLKPSREPQIPLTKVYTHTNYCWLSNKEHLIQVALKEVIYKLNDNFIHWSKLLEMLKKKVIFKKLALHDDKWEYDYFIKDYIKNLFKNQKWQLKCQRDGVIKIQQILQKASNQEEIMSSRMDQEMSQLHLGLQLESQVQKSINEKQRGPILYSYDFGSLPQRRAKNSEVQVNEEIKSQMSSQESEMFSQSGTQSSSSQNSWKSIQLPDKVPKKIVPKKRKRNIKSRKNSTKQVPSNSNQS